MRHAVTTAALLLLGTTLTHAADIKTENVDYEIDGKTYKGYLATPSADAKPVGVIVVHEWWGLNDYPKKRADMLAKAGYSAFCIDTYGEGKTTKDPKEAGAMAGAAMKHEELFAKHFEKAEAAMKAHAATPPTKFAAIGYCYGGKVVLDVARTGMTLAGVASFHGNLAPGFKAEPGSIKPKVLVLHGDADPMVPPEMVEAFEKEMKSAGADYTLVKYPGAVHAFTNPDADKAGMNGVSYDKSADEKSWAALMTFLGQLSGE
jgi:dienelactone hydrolase